MFPSHAAALRKRDHRIAASAFPWPAQAAAALAPPPLPRILLVDDNEVNRMVAAAQLQRWGIEPTLACDGAEAVALAALQTFDLVLMDVSMPVMNGLEATDRIRHDERAQPGRRRVPVVAYTSGTLTDDPAVMARHDIDGVLHKPSNTREVGECLRQWCALSLD